MEKEGADACREQDGTPIKKGGTVMALRILSDAANGALAVGFYFIVAAVVFIIVVDGIQRCRKWSHK